MKNLTILTITAITVFSCNQSNNQQQKIDIVSDTVFINFNEIITQIDNPVYVTHANNGSGKLFILLQAGKILSLDKMSQEPSVFLDIEDKVKTLLPGFTELGLLGLAFHPEFKSNGRLFVYYTHMIDEELGTSRARISEFKIYDSDPDVADPDSEKVIMEIDYTGFFIAGGQVEFGPDGYLYIGLGTGTKLSSVLYAQDLNDPKGSILRIDVNVEGTYKVPSDNPFPDTEAPEIWAYGFRNPYRFTFEEETGRLIAGDVGDLLAEEINIVAKGRNYGWPYVEGDTQKNTEDDLKLFSPDSLNYSTFTNPHAYYGHVKNGAYAIVGAEFIKKTSSSILDGKMLLADWNGEMFIGNLENSELLPVQIRNIDKYNSTKVDTLGSGDDMLIIPKYMINSLGRGEDGAIYAVGQRSIGGFNSDGAVFKIEFIEDNTIQ